MKTLDCTKPLIDPHAPVAIYEGDCREVLPQLPVVDVVVTDPPYQAFYGLLDYESKGGVIADMTPQQSWMVFAWLWQWFPLLLARTRHAMWFTTDARYLHWYRSLLTPNVHITTWPLEGTEDLHPVLMHLGPEPPVGQPPADLLARYRYGSDSPEAFWAGLIALTPGAHDGLLVDPFCGTGSSLEAGYHAGYRVIGVEHEPTVFAVLKDRMVDMVLKGRR